MANNRDEVAVFIEALAAVVDLEELKEVLNDNFCQSLTFRKDVTAVDTAAGTKTLDFEDIDYITVTQSANSTYTLSNILQGEIKHLKITKTAGYTVDFTGATDISQRKDYIDNLVNNVIYRITNKDNSLYVESINIDNDITPVLTSVIEIGDWNMDTVDSIAFNHGLTYSKIIGISSVLIRNDADTQKISLFGQGASGGELGTAFITPSQINLIRLIGGIFDDANFDSTSYNRGWVIIDYLP